MSVTGTGSGYDLDVHFYDADCFRIDYTDMADADADEEGTVPADAAHAIVVEFNGAPTRFTARPAGGYVSGQLHTLGPAVEPFPELSRAWPEMILA